MSSGRNDPQSGSLTTRSPCGASILPRAVGVHPARFEVAAAGPQPPLRVRDHRPVGRPARCVSEVRQSRRTAPVGIHRVHARRLRPRTGVERDLLAVRRPVRIEVAASLGAQPGDLGDGPRDDSHSGDPAARRNECDFLAVRRPVRCAPGGPAAKGRLESSIHVDPVQLGAAPREHDGLSIRRPRGLGVGCRVSRDAGERRAVEPHGVDVRCCRPRSRRKRSCGHPVTTPARGPPATSERCSPSCRHSSPAQIRAHRRTRPGRSGRGRSRARLVRTPRRTAGRR